MIYAAAITGPTAGGKTALSLQVCRDFEAEIISCDSMQIYKGMDIGTAKATEQEQAVAPHHMIDVITPDLSFSAADYKKMAMPIAKDIYERGKLPLFVGGTGLYLDTIKRSFEGSAPQSSPEYRDNILKSIKCEEDKIALWQRLRSVDEQSAEQIHYNNVKRVIRAIEIYDTTGRPKSYFDQMASSPSEEISIAHVTLDFHNRGTLYARIDKRVDEMIEAGLFDEVMSLLSLGFLSADTTASGAIGYKEIISGLAEGLSTEAIADNIKQASRNYAKRQLTWFRHSKDAAVVFVDDEAGNIRPFDEIYSELKHTLTDFRTVKLNARST